MMLTFVSAIVGFLSRPSAVSLMIDTRNGLPSAPTSRPKLGMAYQVPLPHLSSPKLGMIYQVPPTSRPKLGMAYQVPLPHVPS